MSNLGQTTPDAKEIAREASEMLRRIGWHESDLMQIKIYARMSPAQKVEQMFALRGEFMHVLEARLRREHPDSTDMEIKRLVQWHLDLVRERHLE
jgi:hypothetical protein